MGASDRHYTLHFDSIKICMICPTCERFWCVLKVFPVAVIALTGPLVDGLKTCCTATRPSATETDVGPANTGLPLERPENRIGRKLENRSRVVYRE
jgi:hypothetical protein